MELVRLDDNKCPDGVTCPAVYRTDRGTVVIQGTHLADPAVRGELRFGADEDAVEIPIELFRQAAARADRA